ncbi:MAG: type I DNA topoisomerase [Cyanobacteria bacterium P01_F01_bin.150]
MSTLVIVESPTKAKTIRGYLPSGYHVEASMGHVRDLPGSATDIPASVKGEEWAKLGVNIDSNFEPIYIVPKDKKKVVKGLKDALATADELVLATDEDREGESISWHLLQVLKPKVPTKRMVFHEITEEAIQDALSNCRDIDEQLVHAQETRRILDRLVGYPLSSLLWEKISYHLSAGRVQSVSVRLLVRRERERRAFRKGSYWDLKAQLLHGEASSFDAKLVALDGVRLATGNDFDETTGQITVGRNVVLLDEARARSLQQDLTSQPWSVSSLEERASNRKPSPPFTTSTLQQEANRKLKLSARDTMRTAQGLYERGFITYMRTDSVHLSNQAIAAARTCVEDKYGPEYLSPKPRQYSTKSKGAQEAHEAIRPSGSSFRTPNETGLSGRDLQLYELIWKRTVACQMAEARQTHITAKLQVDNAEFRATGKRIDFPGFFRAYVEGSDDPDAALENKEVILPDLKVGDAVNCQDLNAVGHETQPPARYTEASLVKMLEGEGIGRPSTYASIIGTLVKRNYAQLNNNTLIPTFLAFAVTGLLEEYFPDLVDTGFTAKMERTLDDIATGEVDWLPYLKEFFLGDTGLNTQIKERKSQIDPDKARTLHLEGIDVPIRVGRYGAYLEVEQDGKMVKASIPDMLTPADFDQEQVDVLIRRKLEGPRVVGIHSKLQQPIYALSGRFGPYLQLGDKTEDNPKPKTASFMKGMELETITLEEAEQLLSIPRNLGEHPELGGIIEARRGRGGPYIAHILGNEEDTRSLKKEDNVLTVTLERALELLAIPKKSRRRKAATPLRELGPHPDDEKLVAIYDGPFGKYVKHGRTNASLPEKETVESMTMDLAIELLAAKAGTKTKKKTTKAKSTKAKSTKAKTTAKKSTKAKSTKTKAGSKTTKTTTKKAAAKKATSQSEGNDKADTTDKISSKSQSKSQKGDVLEVVAVKSKASQTNAAAKTSTKRTTKKSGASSTSAKAS